MNKTNTTFLFIEFVSKEEQALTSSYINIYLIVISVMKER